MPDNTAMKIAAGGITAFLEVCVMHPLDLVKTCLQLQRTGPVGVATSPVGLTQYYYTGVVNCIRTVYHQESLLSLWKGVVPPVIIETPRRAANFLLFEKYQQYFLFGSSTATPLTYYAAGLCVGMSEAFVMTPFEVVKIALQADRSPREKAPSTWAVLKKIVAQQDQTLYVFHIMGIGFAAGTLASVVNNPFDVAKTRIQGPQPKAAVIKYEAPLATVATIYREERLRALFKGVIPKILRKGCGGALMVAGFDYTYRYLSGNFTD